jgi:hypothetical protein
MGLAVIFRGDRRLFGRDEGEGSMRRSVVIDATDWIVGLILKIPDIDLTEPKFKTSIYGITVRRPTAIPWTSLLTMNSMRMPLI